MGGTRDSRLGHGRATLASTAPVEPIRRERGIRRLDLSTSIEYVASLAPSAVVPVAASTVGSPLDPTSGIGWLAIAFGLGLIHAFDADHVMALSVFATRGRSVAEGVRAGLRWSLGHGLVILVAGVLLLAVGRALPASVSVLADRAVGLVMIGLGVFVWVELARRRAHLHFHAHDGIPPHAHWHDHAQRARAAVHTSGQTSGQTSGHTSGHARAEHRHEHGAMFVGALHGLAGSAPILAVLPVARHSPALAFAYLVLFGVGVAVAMVGVSGLLGHVAGRLSAQGAGRGLSWFRAVGAGGSVALGIWLLGAA